MFHITKILSCLVTTLIYPYYTLNGYPEKLTNGLVLLFCLEGIFLVDIITKFFLLEINEAGKTIYKPLEQVAGDYIKGMFLFDLLTWLPLGMLQDYEPNLKILWLIKSVRVVYLKQYMSMRFLV